MKLLHSLIFMTVFVLGTYAQTANQTEINYRYKMENNKLKVEKTYFNLGKTYNTEPKTIKTSIFNTTDSVMNLSFNAVPKHIKVKAIPENLPPKTKGEIVVEYNPSENKNYKGVQNWGFQNNRIKLVVNGNKNSRQNYFTVRADIQEDFRNLTEEQLAKAPKIAFKEKSFNFGKVKQGEDIVHEFVFTNEGQNDLEIRRVKGS